jgi:hypothetical protein
LEENDMTYVKGKLSDLIGDRIVYRNLIPADPTLPPLVDVWATIGLDRFRVPRKTETPYAAMIIHLLNAAQEQRGMPPLRGLLFIGDTAMNDGTAARNIGEHLPLRGFIGADRRQEAESIKHDGSIMIANRWALLEEWVKWAQQEGIGCDERTAVLMDIDKTFIGARGRNDKVIDAVRVSAVKQTVEEALGGAFDEDRFRAVYDKLAQPEYHKVTADNQDYLAYISLMVMGDVFPAEEFWTELAEGRLSGFLQFVTLCDTRRDRMEPGLAAAHAEVVANVRKGDPTPFKSFRHREYYATIARMDKLPDDSSREDVLKTDIVITQEVSDIVRSLMDQGALTFGLSDKPDEASMPPIDAVAKGAKAIHQVTMKVLGPE